MRAQARGASGDVQLQRAELRAYDEPGGQEIPELHVPFFLNPSSLRVTKEARLEHTPTFGHTTSVRWKGNQAGRLELGELWFDGYETRLDVRETWIDRLELLMQPVRSGCAVPCVRFVWGEFTHRSSAERAYTFYVESMAVDYTMFLPDGRPVRAKVALTLRQVWPVEAQAAASLDPKGSTAQVHKVVAGQTLQAVATEAYGDPSLWRTIADANRLDDPAALKPGAALLIPPVARVRAPGPGPSR